MTQSTGVFKWRLKHNITDFQILSLSQKNPQTIFYVADGIVVKENTRFKHRIELINDDYATVGFNLSKITRADMGIYSLYVPKLLLESKAILIVTDFAIVPDAVLYRQINDQIMLSWDITALRKLCDIKHEIFLTTPATGRLHLDTYFTQWLKDNPGRHAGVSQPTDYLHPTVTISNVTMKDAGYYIIEVTLSSSVHRWLNFSWHHATELVISGTDYFFPSWIAIVLGVLLGIATTAIVVLLCICRKRGIERSRLKPITQGSAANDGRRLNEMPRLRDRDDDGYEVDNVNITDIHDGLNEMPGRRDRADDVNEEDNDPYEEPPLLPPRCPY